MHEPTISFSIHEDKEKEMKEILTAVYDALRQKGYNPINQIVGYILSEDPTYITTHNNARSLIRRIDRDELLQILVKSYLNDWECAVGLKHPAAIFQQFFNLPYHLFNFLFTYHKICGILLIESIFNSMELQLHFLL